MLAVACCQSVTAHAQAPELLKRALRALSDNRDHWAYTQTSVVHEKIHGTTRVPRKHGTEIFRFDPSRPYAEQFVPILVDGRAPTPADFENYRKRGIARAEAKEKRREAEEKSPSTSDEPPHLELKVPHLGTYAVEFSRATLAREDAASVTFLVPIAQGASEAAVGNFVLEFEVSKATATFRRLAFRTLAPVHMLVVLKVAHIGAVADFAPVAAEFPPVVTHERVEFEPSLLFVKFPMSVEVSRENFVRVKPFDDQFGVKIGPLKSLEL